MKLIDRETGTIVAEIITNHSMSIDEALDLEGFTVAEDGQIMDGEKGLHADYENLEMCWETIGHWNKGSWGTETPPENVYDLMNKVNDLIDVFHVQHGFDSDLTREYSNDLWEQYCRTGKVEPLQDNKGVKAFIPDYDSSNLSSVYKFIRVTGEDGVFFDLVRDVLVAKHIEKLKEGGYEAEKVARKAVPPCQFRYFGEDLSRYRDSTWRGGGDFYHPQKNEEKKPSVQDRLKEASGARIDAPLAPYPMNIYFVTSGTADNYIMVETSEGILCSNCAPDGEFAGVNLSSYDDNSEKISGEVIAAKIAEALDPDITEDDLAWMGDPCYSNIAAWKAEQEAAEYFNRDEAFFVGSFASKEINARQVEKAKPSVQNRLKEALKEAGGARADVPKASSPRKEECL